MHDITTEIHQRAATLRRFVTQLTRRKINPPRKAALETLYGTNLAGADNFQQLQESRMKTIMKSLDQVSFTRRLDHQPGLGRVERKGFFAEHVFTGA